MTTYEQTLIEECEQRAALLVRNLYTTGELLREDADVVDETARKQVDANDMVAQEAQQIKTALQNVMRGNKYRRFMFWYIVIAYVVVSYVCRFF